MTNRIGDRPRFPLPNQRFDKGDAENIAQYYEEIISRFTGSIYGQAWGCVSNPGFSVVPVVISGAPTQYHMRFERCVLLYSVPEQGSVQAPGIDRGPWQATLVAYDPDEESQPVQSLIVNAFATTQSRPWILFRRRETSSSVGNKAYWDTALNTERIGTANLKQAEYVEFRLSLSYTTSDTTAGWYRMAYIDSWAGTGASATPTIIPIHWMDSQYYADNTPPTQSVAVGSALASPSFGAAFGEKGFNPYNEMPNLAKLMHWIAGKLGQHYSTTSTLQVSASDQALYNVKPGAFVLNYGDVGGGWLSTPERGLLELHNDLATAEQDIVDLNQDIVYLNARDDSLSQASDLFMTRYMRTTRLLHTLYVTPVLGDTSAWEDYTFDVRVTSAQEPSSFSPRLGTWSDTAAALRYIFVPQTLGGSDGRYLTFTIGSSLTQPAAQTYEISSIAIVAHEYPEVGTSGSWGDLIVQQRYWSSTGPTVPVPPLTLTDSAELSVFFVVQSIEDDVGRARPFTINIYGRNV